MHSVGATFLDFPQITIADRTPRGLGCTVRPSPRPSPTSAGPPPSRPAELDMCLYALTSRRYRCRQPVSLGDQHPNHLPPRRCDHRELSCLLDALCSWAPWQLASNALVGAVV